MSLSDIPHGATSGVSTLVLPDSLAALPESCCLDGNPRRSFTGRTQHVKLDPREQEIFGRCLHTSDMQGLNGIRYETTVDGVRYSETTLPRQAGALRCYTYRHGSVGCISVSFRLQGNLPV